MRPRPGAPQATASRWDSPRASSAAPADARFLNIRLDGIRVEDPERFPHLVSDGGGDGADDERGRGDRWRWAERGACVPRTASIQPRAPPLPPCPAPIGIRPRSHSQLAVKNIFIRGSVVRYVRMPARSVDTTLLEDATRRGGWNGAAAV